MTGRLRAYITGITEACKPVGFHNLVRVSELRSRGWASGGHAARSYSLISPPRTLRRHIFAVARSVTAAGVPLATPGGHSLRARCGRCWL